MSNTNHNDTCVGIALKYIKKREDYIEFIKNFDNPRGFTYSRSDILDKINNVIENHECSKVVSFAECMNICRDKLNLENPKKLYI